MIRNFISITWTPDVDIRDARLLGRTIEDVYRQIIPEFGPIRGQFDPLPAVRVFGAWSIPDMPNDSAFSNVRWYVSHTLSDSGQEIIASRYLRMVNLEPWQGTHPHFDLALTNMPLIDDTCGETPAMNAMGFSRRGLISLISTHPFDSISNFSHRGRAFQWMCAHYIGRMFDAPRYQRTINIDTHNGDAFCTNECVMRYTESPHQALIYARDQEQEDPLFCPTCLQDIAAQVTGFHYGLN